jgi:hypothetical protein
MYQDSRRKSVVAHLSTLTHWAAPWARHLYSRRVPIKLSSVWSDIFVFLQARIMPHLQRSYAIIPSSTNMPRLRRSGIGPKYRLPQSSYFSTGHSFGVLRQRRGFLFDKNATGRLAHHRKLGAHVFHNSAASMLLPSLAVESLELTILVFNSMARFPHCLEFKKV